MWVSMTILVFVFVLGSTIGGLLVSAKLPPRPASFLLFGFLFFAITYGGMFAGMFLDSFLMIRLLDVILVVISLLFIVACFKTFHPTFGFFQQERKLNLLLVAVIFFILGLEWGILGHRTVFTLFASALFLLGLFLGGGTQQRIRTNLWRLPYHVFFPLTWLLFVTVLKLL
ncbi:hypothetical protein [Halalkalibacterium ligniniphilum]|uniref:hypothetical protein n=1 Tax=Halalkalibacterium ligniniphilum TaxID=1134413 RepID=UPI00034AF7DF|nr:hypothetical protein [Halalkalibacterium ligniniphilum]